jgi:competence protein ComEC
MKKIFVPLFIIMLTSLSVHVVYQTRTPSTLLVSFLNVGQGDAIFIQSPSGIQVLLDGGPNTFVLEELHHVMPLFDQSIDMIIASHPDSDHISGLIDVLDRFQIGVFLESGAKNDNGVQNTLNTKIAQKNIPTRVVRRGEVYDLGANVFLTILYPHKDVEHVESNAGSIVARLTYGEHSFLLTGDAPIDTELALVGADNTHLQSTVLKLGHHGSDTSSATVFLASVNSDYAIVSAGKKNKYNHPHPDVIDRVQKFESQILKTSEQGTITFSTNGKVIEVLDPLEDFQAKKPE